VRVVLESVLRIDAADALAVYGELSGLRPGLMLLDQHLSRQMQATHLEQARYAASLMAIERRLSSSPQIAAQLTNALRTLDDARDERAIDDPWTVAGLADAYSKHVSPLLPRVMVSGEPVHLQTAANANRIRALLLAGLRATTLWRQCGGNRIKLLLFRAAMQSVVKKLLDSLT
jgi:high frequency lysogenization protein